MEDEKDEVAKPVVEKKRVVEQRVLTFGEALEQLKKGLRVSRFGWNGKGMWLELVEEYSALNIKNGLLPWIGMKTVDNCFVPWVASQSDMLTQDWFIVKEEE